MSQFQDFMNKIKRRSRIKKCFIDDDSCSSRIIRAHSIQNNRILSKIAENGHVIQIKSSNLDFSFSVDSVEVGRKIATIATNFCEFHDASVFTEIELKNYKKYNDQQEFLYAYRAFAKEYHAKHEAKNMFREALDHQNIKNNEIIKQMIQGNMIALNQMESERKIINNALKKSNFKYFDTYILEFRGTHGLAVSSVFDMEYDFKGNQINNLLDFEKKTKLIFLTVFPQGQKTFVLFSFYRKYRKIFSSVWQQISSQDTQQRQIMISNLILAYVENFVLSPSLWKNLSSEEKHTIKGFFMESLEPFQKHLSEIKMINLFSHPLNV